MKPCPFCGSIDVDAEGVLSEDKTGNRTTYHECQTCGANTPAKNWENRSLETSLSNQITELQKEIAELKEYKNKIETQQRKAIDKVNNNPFTRTYFLLDGREKTYDLKEEIKAKGGKWNADFKCWVIETSGEKELEIKSYFKMLGLTVQAK